MTDKENFPDFLVHIFSASFKIGWEPMLFLMLVNIMDLAYEYEHVFILV